MTRPHRPRVGVVIPAGGSGTRVGGGLPKQFLKLGSESILVATARCFAHHPSVDLVVVAAPAAHLVRTRRLLEALRGRASVAVVPGGAERQESVWHGLRALPESIEIVLVHDAVRPFVTRSLIDDVLGAARATGAAICARPIAETVKRVVDGVVRETLDRRGLWAVQTPQGFRADLLRAAHESARRHGLAGTDDAALVERLGQPVQVVPGIAENIKITTPEDLRLARRARPVPWARSAAGPPPVRSPSRARTRPARTEGTRQARVAPPLPR